MDAKILGSNIRKYRLEKGLTQESVADLVGLSVNYYRQIELGNKVPQLKTFVRIAASLDASADKLLEGNLTIADIQKTSTILDEIANLPAKKRQLVLSQLETLLQNIKNY